VYFCEENLMRSLTAESRANRGREGGEEKERERKKRRERENKEGALYVCAFAQCGLQPAAGAARRRRRYFFLGKFNYFPIKKNRVACSVFLVTDSLAQSKYIIYRNQKFNFPQQQK
jgi:hypothetical protein